ncbi:hypothetical protein [Winogradskyella sp. MIT101101]|uniref:hypothetical protein n=1 Tax=Winogradskyella sp. MIT101101 TaxID=3098297 RepID=UPI00399BBB60
MMKTICRIACLFLTTLIFGQESSLIQNINFRAKDLKHSLNASGDSLLLESEFDISKVNIYNNTFEKTFIVEKQKAKIPLAKIPNGRFVTEVKVQDKLIIITLLRHKALNTVEDPIVDTDSEKTTTINEITLTNEAEGKTLPITDTKEQPVRNVRFYWIVKLINKGHSSSKKMRIGDREVVDRMIAQHKIDLKSKAGKHNELTIWEVYDTTEFMRFKRQNPDYANSQEANCFNTVPFYKS